MSYNIPVQIKRTVARVAKARAAMSTGIDSPTKFYFDRTGVPVRVGEPRKPHRPAHQAKSRPRAPRTVAGLT